MRTAVEHVGALERCLIELHPDEVAESPILVTGGGNERYLDWIRRNMHSEDA